jgi:hypothetical protein
MATIEWTEISKSEIIYSMIVYSEKDKIYSAVGFNNDLTKYYISNSTDGVTWTNSFSIDYIGEIPQITIIRGYISYVKEQNIYIVFLPTPNDLNNTDCYTSNNGTSWTRQSTINGFSADIYSDGLITLNPTVVYSSISNRYMGILMESKLLDNSSTVLISSNDGKIWNTNNSINAFILEKNVILTSIQYNSVNNSFLAVLLNNGNGNSFIMVSDDGGDTWSISLQVKDGLTQVICTDTIISCLGGSDKDTIVYTSDPKSYSWERNIVVSGRIIAIGQISYNNRVFLAKGYATTISLVSFSLTSLDGINWIINNFENNYFYLGYAYSPITNTYIIQALSENGTTFYNGVISFNAICLPSGSPIVTDQGIVEINKIDKLKHTINRKGIVAVTQTITPEKTLICFEKHSLAINCPKERTIMTQGHEVLYKGKLVQAKDFLGRLNGVHTVPYDGKILYNVLQESHGLMTVNNMTVETLNPKNKIAKIILGTV